jgi:acyl carrier protein
VNSGTPDNVRVFVADFLNRKLKDRGQGPLSDLPDDYDVLLSGALDSLAFVEMMMAAGEHFVGEIDFESLDPEKMTVVGPLCVFVSEQLTKRQ